MTLSYQEEFLTSHCGHIYVGYVIIYLVSGGTVHLLHCLDNCSFCLLFLSFCLLSVNNFQMCPSHILPLFIFFFASTDPSLTLPPSSSASPFSLTGFTGLELVPSVILRLVVQLWSHLNSICVCPHMSLYYK